MKAFLENQAILSIVFQADYTLLSIVECRSIFHEVDFVILQYLCFCLLILFNNNLS
jgi:hypothetical protein